jgi:disulfide bond formation protein DsbB
MKSTLRLIALRYLGAILLIVAAGLASDPSAFFVILPVAIISVKYLIYDTIVSVVQSAGPNLQTKPWFYLGYGLAVAGDMFFVWGATRDQVDAGFAFLGTLVFTPWILIAAFIAILVATIVTARKKKRPLKSIGKRKIIDV